MTVQNVLSVLWVLLGRKLANIQHFRLTLLEIEDLCTFGKRYRRHGTEETDKGLQSLSQSGRRTQCEKKKIKSMQNCTKKKNHCEAVKGELYYSEGPLYTAFGYFQEPV